MDFSSCSMVPSSSRLDDDFSTRGRRDRSPAGSGMSCLSNWEFDYGGERGWGNDRSYCDPIDLLPADPFGMNLTDTFTAALANLVSDHAVRAGDFDAGSGDYLLSGFNYYGYGGLPPVYECWLGFGGAFGFGDSAQDRGFLNGLNVGECSNSDRVEEACGGGDEDGIHQGLLFSLAYLGVQDLLSIERVCKSLQNAVQTDALLWRSIHIGSPLSEKITDEDLVRLTQRAQGSLHSLSLVGCSKLTDDGLKRVLESNPRLQKLSVPGCVRLSVEGLVNNLKAIKTPAMPKMAQLRLGRLFSITPENYDDLKSLIGSYQLQQSDSRKPRFYHCCPYSLSSDDESSMDIEVCPGCQKVKLVYDCPAESCRGKGPEECRACDICIARCVQCGKCIKNCEYEETFCLENLCSDCWKQPTFQPENEGN